MELLITERGVIVAARIIECIAINPKNQPPERVEHLRRSDEETELRLRRSYIVRMEPVQTLTVKGSHLNFSVAILNPLPSIRRQP